MGSSFTLFHPDSSSTAKNRLVCLSEDFKAACCCFSCRGSSSVYTKHAPGQYLHTVDDILSFPTNWTEILEHAAWLFTFKSLFFPHRGKMCSSSGVVENVLLMVYWDLTSSALIKKDFFLGGMLSPGLKLAFKLSLINAHRKKNKSFVTTQHMGGYNELSPK